MFESSIDCPPLEYFESFHDDPNIIESVNVYLIRKILTNRVDITEIICKQFYDVEWRVHNGVETEMFLCLHKYLKILVVKTLIDSKFPGLLTRFTDLFFLRIKNKIKESEDFTRFAAILKTILALELTYLDQFKDVALTFWILGLIGGFPSLFNLPYNFTSVVICSMLFSITVPLLLSGFHLAANNPDIVWKSLFKRETNISKRWLELISIGMSILNPILLTNACEQEEEKTRKLAKFCDHGVINGMKNTRRIKIQSLKSRRIELGNTI